MTRRPDTSPTLAELERRSLDRLEVAYRERGCEFHRGEATRAVLPERLHAALPDAVAIGASGKEMIQILGSRRPRGAERVQEIRELLRGETGWKLIVVHVDRIESEERRTIGRGDAVSLAREARALGDEHPRAALLLYWSALEGLLRELEPPLVRHPMTPLQLIDALDSYDYIGSSERGDLERAATLRDALAHGDSVTVDDGILDGVASVADRLAEMGRGPAPAGEAARR